MEVGRQDRPRYRISSRAPIQLVQVDARVSAIVVIPGRQVTRGLQLVVSTGIVYAKVQREVQPAVTLAERHIRREVIGMCHITIGYCCTVQVDVTHLVIVAAVDASAEVPAIQSVKPQIEGTAAVDTPVAVDVLRTRDAAASGFVIGDNVANGVGCTL